MEESQTNESLETKLSPSILLSPQSYSKIRRKGSNFKLIFNKFKLNQFF